MPLFRSRIEASELKAKYKLQMIAWSLIRDVSVSSSLKEEVGGTYAVERKLVAGRDVVACLSPRRRKETAHSLCSPARPRVTTGFCKSVFPSDPYLVKLPAAGGGWKPASHSSNALEKGEALFLHCISLGNSHAGVLFYFMFLLCRKQFHRCLHAALNTVLAMHSFTASPLRLSACQRRQ